MKPALWFVISGVAVFTTMTAAADDFFDKLKSATEKLQKLEGQLPQTPPTQRSAPQTAVPPAHSPSQPAAQGQGAPNAASASSEAPPPSAPAGTLDPSKLPDIVGIHLGDSVQEAHDKIKTLFPPTPQTQVLVYYQKFQTTSDKP